MWRSFGDVADRSRGECNALATGAHPAAAFDHLADNIFIVMIDLFGVGALARSKTNDAGGESLLLAKIVITDFVVKLAQAFERGAELDGFHFSQA